MDVENLRKWYAAGHKNFSEANLERSNLNFACLDGANLSRSNMRFAHLRGASLRGVNLHEAVLRSVTMPDGTVQE